MKLTRCPVCHNDISLEALLEDDAGKELLAIITKLTHGCSRPLVAYIGLFRTQKSNLSNSRAAKLMSEVLELYKPSRHLAHALSKLLIASEINVHRVNINHSKIIITLNQFMNQQDIYLLIRSIKKN